MTCALASKDCAGPLEWHHVIKQQRLKRQFPRGAWSAGLDCLWEPIPKGDTIANYRWAVSLDYILGDTRNRVWACKHHHELVTNARPQARITTPESVWEFAREFGLEGMLENDLRRAA